MLYGLLLLLGLTGCSDDRDDGSRAFMSEATIVGDADRGYSCYLDGGGRVVTHDRRLDGIERGYFEFRYTESDWTDTALVGCYIRNARVLPYSVYEIIRPVGTESSGTDSPAGADNREIPPHLSLGQGCFGYFDLHTGIRIANLQNGESIPVEMEMSYDPAEQTPDTLRLRLHYHPEIPAGWPDTHLEYGSVSCDLSALASLVQWSDSVTVAVDAGDEKPYLVRIGRNDLFKPDMGIE